MKSLVKRNGWIMCLFIGIIMLYSMVMIAMYHPSSLDALNAMFEVLPDDFMRALGFSQVFHNLEGYLASWLYGLIMTAFPLVYCIIMGNRLVVNEVEDGAMALLLATSVSRVKVIVTKAFFALGSVILMQMVVFGLNTLCSILMVGKNALNVEIFFKLNLTVMLVNMCAMAIVFFFSSLFNEKKYSLLCGCGVTVIFLLMDMMSNVSSDIEFLKDFTIYGWYDPVGITNGHPVWMVHLILLGIIGCLMVASVFVFRKKQMPI